MAPGRGPIRWLHHLGLSRPRPEESVSWEIEHHIGELADRLIEEGWGEEDARREAERRFGDPKRYGPPMRRMERRRKAMERRMQWADVVRQGFLAVARDARRQPGFAAAIVLTLGLGIGANATMYTVVDRLLLRAPDHIVDHERVRRVLLSRPHFATSEIQVGATLTYADYTDLKAHEGFEAVAAYTPSRETTIGSGASATRAQAVLASAELFPLLGVAASLGRFYTSDEEAIGAPLTAVLGYEYWRRAYGASRDVLGRTVEVGGRPFTIIGVAPEGFTGVDLSRVDLWLPLEATQAAEQGEAWVDLRTWWWMRSVARLKRDVSIEAAEAEATRLHHNGRRELIEEERYSSRSALVLGSVIAARGPLAPGEAQVSRWLVGVSLIVLLIACANVANLLMARATRRRTEIGVRFALGASRWRIVGHTIAESVVLAAGGGALALAIAHRGGGVVRSVLLPGVHFAGSAMSLRLLAFTTAVAVVAGVLAGAAPALQGGRLDLARDLRDGVRGSSGHSSRLRSLLTVAQAAMSVVLLVGAGLFVRSLSEIRSLDLGLDVDRVLLAELEVTGDTERNALYADASRRVAALPGVESAAATAVQFGSAYSTRLAAEGVDSIPQLEGGGPYHYSVDPTYFRTVGLEVVRGRGFTRADGPDAAPVTVVSATMADQLWPDGDPIGRCLLIGSEPDGCTTVVGVAEDAALGGLQDAPFMAYYLPMEQSERTHNGLYVRATGDAEELTAEVARLLGSFSPAVRFAHVRTLREIIDPQARAWTLGATMFTVFGVLALILAAIGLYSVLAFDVAQRTREIGIRTTLGAEKARLLSSVVGRGARLALTGVLLGTAVAYLAAPRIGELLFGVSPRDPVTMLAVGAILCAVGLAASLMPALRATRVDPMVALRSE